MSWSFCLWQAFRPSLVSQSLSERSTFQVLPFVLGSWPYPQTLDLTGKACKGQTLQLIWASRMLQRNFFSNNGPAYKGIHHCIIFCYPSLPSKNVCSSIQNQRYLRNYCELEQIQVKELIEIIIYTQREQACTAWALHALDHFAWA